MAEGNKAAKEKIEETGGELTAIPNEKWKKFFDKGLEFATLDVAQWKLAHLLMYFSMKYRETYGISYSWKYNNQNPNKSFEVWQMNTLAAKLSANPKILRDYIDWVFSNKLSGLKQRFRSISFITKDETTQDYKMNVLLAGQKNLQVDRSTQLPPNYMDIMNNVGGVKVSTYGDLAFLAHMDPMPDNIAKALEQLAEFGLDQNVLKRIV